MQFPTVGGYVKGSDGKSYPSSKTTENRPIADKHADVEAKPAMRRELAGGA